MSDKYCKKSSLEAVANEVRTRAGLASSNKLTTAQMKTTIDNLAIPAQRGSPSVALTASSSSYTIQKGKYTGGTVSVTGQGKTATLSQNGGTVIPDSGKVLTSVTVPAKDTMSVAAGIITPSSNATSFSVTGLSFRPIGISIMQSKYTTKTGNTNSPYFIAGIFNSSGVVVGITGVSSRYYGRIQSAAVSITNSSISVSNISSNRNGTTEAGKFTNTEHTYFVWG